MKQVQVIGWYNHRNIGDESYKLSFRKLFPNVEFKFSDIAGKIESCDTCVLGGGDILYPHYINKLLSIPAKQRLIISVSANQKIIPELAKVDKIFVRDHRSLVEMQSKDIPCTWMPDISFCLEPNRENGKLWIENQFHENNLELYENKIGIVLNSHLYHSNPDLLTRDFLNLTRTVWDLAKLADNVPASFIFFPMSTQMPSDDRITNSMIAGKCKFWNKNLVIYDKLSVQKTLDIISACNIVISSRLHSTVFSIVSEVPVLTLNHHDKMLGLIETANMKSCSLSYWSLNYESLQNLMSDILKRYLEYQENVRKTKKYFMDILEQEAKNVHFI